jgi:alpha-glucosidase
MTDLKWWQKAVFYQIYPRSFADGNADGIGDFKGMISKLDYLQDLGVDALWLSPHYPSPNYDCGYDISDFTAVAPEYGTPDDFKAFLQGAHQRGMRVILDLVLNHTSDQHAWFLESRSSRDNPRRDWYIWRDPRPGGCPPNNWNATFEGSAWEFDPQTGQYYYHFFLKQQPDLNWRNPAVKKAMFDAVRFWLDVGVDGFRLDAIGTIFEHPELPDHPLDLTRMDLRHLDRSSHSPEERAHYLRLWKAMFQYQVEQPGMHELMQELRAVVDEYGAGERVLVGENELVSYHGDGNNELHMVFNFPLMEVEHLTPAHVRANQQQRLAELAAIAPECWPCNTLGNHDTPRLYSRFRDGQHDDELARLHLALLLTLRGTPFLYNGDELGMTDLFLKDIRQFRDTVATWAYHAEMEAYGTAQAEAMQQAAVLTRDKCRTPLQWENAPQGGFCPVTVTPWLPVNPNYARGVNVADQQADPGSLLNFYRQMLRLRRQTPALIAGDYLPLDVGEESCLAFLRQMEAQACLVALNFSEKELAVDPSKVVVLPGQRNACVLYPDRQILKNNEKFELPPFGILIVALN